jgi:zinc protease
LGFSRSQRQRDVVEDPQAMEILADVVRHPTFKSEEVERLRQQYLDNLTLALGDPGRLRVCRARVSCLAIVLTVIRQWHDGVAHAITAADIAKMHSRYYRPDNAILVIGGDISAKMACAGDEVFWRLAKADDAVAGS